MLTRPHGAACICDDSNDCVIQASVVVISLDHDRRSHFHSGSRRERNGHQDEVAALDSHGLFGLRIGVLSFRGQPGG